MVSLQSGSFLGDGLPEETQGLLAKKVASRTYRQCCCCSIGTGVTLWAVFLVGVSLYFLFDLNIKGAIFTTGAVVSLITAALLLFSAGQQNAFLAYIAFYMQILVYMAWIAEAAVSGIALWQTRNASLPTENNYEDSTKRLYDEGGWNHNHYYNNHHPLLRAIISEYPVSHHIIQETAEKEGRSLYGKTSKFLLGTFRQVDIPLYVYEALLMGFYAVQLLLAHFVLRMLWSFYKILQAGGTTFEKRSAEDLEAVALRYQLPSYTADETPREDTSQNER